MFQMRVLDLLRIVVSILHPSLICAQKHAKSLI